MDNKDIIKDIIKKLRDDNSRPYKQGAWENYKQKYDQPSKFKPIRPWIKWTSTAAALVIIGFGMTQLWNKDASNKVDILVENTQDNPLRSNSPSDDASVNNLGTDYSSKNEIILSAIQNKNFVEDRVELKVLNNSASALNALYNSITIPNIEFKEIPLIESLNLKKQIEDNLPNAVHVGQQIVKNEGVLANQAIENQTSKVDDLNTSSAKQFSLNNKVNLSLFVSPFATNDKLNVGGGLAVAYKLNNKLALRTGASYNSYEVGVLKNPMDPAQAEVVHTDHNMSIQQSEMANVSTLNNRMILPNINAVNGVVQTIEIPLELQVNLNKTFYASAGASYSAIINQRREAKYIEQVSSNAIPFSKAATVQAITKTINSAENNVNTNGFSGFVNISLGKKVNVRNGVNLAIEPYLKVPVGQYRRADMDYTNGGIRIMTNF